ncbi:hypothetical protein Kpol_1028p99 [Vanderwaltozyma polyspora DSM 70294]|uniref:Manganese/iron superoxide dismutase C-terminal domain-containing protein n=1 Tax=Vanderwaltozyma polyspora (strain ATCC 22028 / DSM 70294 / BCRC 21397 / CBS 2163 / NBRC 10782 / NRRL Y-8283 / UCD 57-17) TaxID=436907 RepID=A7TG66_VANPO|nr:uncharacterized protein Kpol_1028p99 [Vanderwaltozyma polyspora DSM 70294]EDO18823.1 hypothetical protein Kpol_1028p99 [Vanderwaltozyma polyspora DSM 70294]
MFSTLKTVSFRRGIHTVPKLPNSNILKQRGIPNIFSAAGFNIAWNEQQKYLCDKLTLLTSGSDLESFLPFHIILNTAKRPFQANIFNVASAAHNNHLFIENILPDQDVDTKPSRLFLSTVEKSFDCSWEDLKKEMIYRAENDIFGEGWLFLVENRNKEYHILTVQNNGTPYYFPRNQSFDLNSATSLQEYSQLHEIKRLVTEQDGKNGKEKVEDWTMPLICVNLWDQAYLHDYGVKGRSEYVKNVLDNLNWSVVNQRIYTNPNA